MSRPTANGAGAPIESAVSARFHRAIVVANPIAGRGRAASAARELADGLASLGVAHELWLTRERGDARLRLRALAEDADLVVAVGGDGTVAEVLDGLVDRAVPVAILPAGTGNVIGHDLALPRDVDRALEMIVRAKTVQLDVARVNGRRLSFLATGVGFDALVVAELERLRRGPITKTTWALAAWNAMRKYAPPRLHVEIDGQPVDGDCGWVLFSNVVHYGGVRFLSSDRRLDDGLFEAYLFERGSTPQLLWYAARGLANRLPGGSCRMLRAKRMVVTADVPVPYHVDGDVGGETPVEIEVGSQPCTLLVP